MVSGGFGLLPAAIATPLALVLTELLQNALKHGLASWPGSASGGSVLVHASRDTAALTVHVDDNGGGLPRGFSLDATTSLGLQIVRTLVETELGGRLTIAPRPGGGTRVVVGLPVGPVAPAPPEPGAAKDDTDGSIDAEQSDTEQATAG